MTKDADAWTCLWERSQRSPFLHGAAVRAYAERAVPTPALALHGSPRPTVGILLEERNAGLVTPLPLPDPLVLDRATGDPEAVLEVVQRTCHDHDVSEMWFPLVDANSRSAKVLAITPGVARWARTPSPTVDWSDRGDSLWRRVCERHGSQAVRKRNRFEKEMRVVDLASDRVDEAVAAIKQIEARSWKHQHGLLLLSGQLEYFAELVSHGQAFVAVALKGELPVAYRFDALHNETVYTVRWSYDDAFRRYAPGFYLLTKGLVQRWQNTSLDRIHLLGYPDTLKELIQDGSEPRWDFFWPDGDRATQLRDEAVAFDRRRAEQYLSGVGLRHFFK